MDDTDAELAAGPVQLSVDEFRRQLDSDIRKICADRGWSYDSESRRGWAFQFWVADRLRERDRGISTDPEEGVLLTREGGIDVVLEDGTERVVYLVQTKFVSTASRPPVDRAEVEAFFSKHELLLDRSWVRKNVSHRIIDQIGYYSDLFSREYRVLFYFVTTGRDVYDKADSLVKAYNERHKSHDVEFFLLDFEELKRFYIESKTLEQSIPEHVGF
jgi:hypothetical protein